MTSFEYWNTLLPLSMFDLMATPSASVKPLPPDVPPAVPAARGALGVFAAEEAADVVRAALAVAVFEAVLVVLGARGVLVAVVAFAAAFVVVVGVFVDVGIISLLIISQPFYLK